MTPEHDPCTVPVVSDLVPETLAGLVHSSHRMCLFWPVPAASPDPLPRPRPRSGFAVPPRTASLVAAMADYGD